MMAQTQEVGTHKTLITQKDDATMVWYHSTMFVYFDKEDILLDTGGWKTYTTKLRMNQTSNQFGLGYYVFQRDHQWYVDYQGEIRPFINGSILLKRGGENA